MAQRPAVVADLSLELRWFNSQQCVMDKRWAEARHTKPLLACPNQDGMRRQPLSDITQALNIHRSMSPTMV
jgi:hypothetical protein